MARKKVEKEKPVVSLETLIPQYAENKALMDDYKKKCDEENKQIKEIMMANNSEKEEAAGYVATCKVSYRETMDEDKLLDILREAGLSQTSIIKTKEYVDLDELESAIYKGLIDKDVLMKIDKCRESKEVVTLRVSKSK